MTFKKQDICCPTCAKKNTWDSNNPFRPFCSDRCRLIDLGEWASDEHRIAGDPVDPNAINDDNVPD